MNTLKSYLIISALTLTSLVYGQKNSNLIEVPDGRTISAETLNQHISKAMDSLKLPGLSIAIVNGNKIAYHNTFGVKNNKTKTPVTAATIFEGASLSKPLFAYFVMKMVEDGKIDLDKPIYPYLEPIFPEGTVEEKSLEYYKRLTPRIILSHGTGIPNWVRGEPIKIAFKPGTDFSYSGEAYQHLGAAFALKQGIDWGSKLDSLFIKEAAIPIGMDRTLYTWDSKYENAVANGHLKGNVNSKINRFKKVGPGFSLHTDAEDYALFLIEMMHPKNITEATRDEMLKTHNLFKENNALYIETGQTGWGLGFAQKPTPNGLMHLHTGNNQDFQAYTMFIPEQDYGFVMFANSDNLFPFLEKLEELIGEHF
ncbi:MAG: class A beta-lactamase-related serine hydrolase [Winogradskyella sp.]|uniref:serine hydrolase domain-containing protein n=1 Tax=Winogradskyella sp. TaxID=1883156 RepID=UPI000F3B4E80|nr:serine hydrolase domain-containing protein [Winogradskyella sp.]RNC88342.1 MAG: class A beta-lactamase-related serine hydrolase [Winogradskyella sp.]